MKEKYFLILFLFYLYAWMDQSDSNKKNANTVTFFGNVNPKTFISGTVAGVSSTIIFHPLELIKIRWQVYESITLKNLIKKETLHLDQKIISNSPVYRPKYRSLFDTFNTVYKSENGFRGLYRGLLINSFASGSAWGIYFLIYNGLKSRRQQIINSNSSNGQTNSLSFLDYTIDATAAGVFTICITNPLFLIKTRMCLQYSNVNLNTNNLVKYNNSWEALKILVKQDGFFGLYKGIIPGLFGTLNGTIQMVSYDLMKSWWLKHLEYKHSMRHDSNNIPPPKLDTTHFSIFSSLSKILSVVCTYPFQLVRARIQDQHQSYRNLSDVIKKTYKNEKIYGFYKGLIPCLIRVTPAASVTFIVYENLLQFLENHY